MAPTKTPSAMAYTGARKRASGGLNEDAITAANPIRMAKRVQLGNRLTSLMPFALVVTSTRFQPHTAADEEQDEEDARGGDRAVEGHRLEGRVRADRPVVDRLEASGGVGRRQRVASRVGRACSKALSLRMGFATVASCACWGSREER